MNTVNTVTSSVWDGLSRPDRARVANTVQRVFLALECAEMLAMEKPDTRRVRRGVSGAALFYARLTRLPVADFAGVGRGLRGDFAAMHAAIDTAARLARTDALQDVVADGRAAVGELESRFLIERA